MNYIIARGGTQLGAFAEAEIQDGLRYGRFLPDDLAWREGMVQWAPLSTVISPAISPPPLPSQIPTTPSDILPPARSPHQAEPSNQKLGDNLGMRLLLPVGRSAWAVTAGYLGLFSLLGVFAPFSIIVSLIAIRDIQKSNRPGHAKKYGMGRAIFGLLMGIAFTLLPVALWLSSRR